MLQVEAGCILVGFGDGQQFGFTIELSQEGEAYGCSGAAGLKFTVPYDGFWSVIATETIGQDDCRMSGKVCDHQLRASGGSDNYIHLAENFVDLIDGHGAGAVCLNVFHRRDKARSAEGVGPVAGFLLREQLIASAAGEI